MPDTTPTCSFCGLPASEVASLIAGPCVAICNSCVELCQDVLDNQEHHQPITDRVVEVALPAGETTAGELRALLARHHGDMRVRVKVE